MIFLDTCIIIDYLKQKEIKTFIDNSGKSSFGINSIVIMELYKGAFNRLELQKIKKEISGFRLLDINQEIMNLATDLIEKFSLSHNLKEQDSILASTSIIYDLEMFTYNLKDFKYIPNIKLYKMNNR